MVRGDDEIRSLYVHVPFCTSKCAYCAFASVTARPVPFEPYFEALRAEARPWLGRLWPRTVYVGGGTPSCLEPAELGRLLGWLRSLCPAPPAEWTVEANPESLDARRVGTMAAAGVTRISLGAQSFDAAALRYLGRRHSGDDARRAAALVGDCGLSLSLDLIAAVPAESDAGWSRTLDDALALCPDHLSVYCLSWEPGTPLTAALREGRTRRFSADEEIRRLRLADRKLRGAGLRRYEISNYARPGAECRHNVDCWRMRAYLGLGPSAASFVDGARWTNTAETEPYLALARGAADVRREFEAPSPIRVAVEAAAFGIRMVAGWSRTGFRQATGFDWDDLWPEAIRHLRREGLLVSDRDRLALTLRGRDLADAVATWFLDPAPTGPQAAARGGAAETPFRPLYGSLAGGS